MSRSVADRGGTRDHDVLDYTTEPMHHDHERALPATARSSPSTCSTPRSRSARHDEHRDQADRKTIDNSRRATMRGAIVVSHDGSLALHEVATGAEVWAINDPAASFPDVVFDPSGRRFAFASDVGASPRSRPEPVASIVILADRGHRVLANGDLWRRRRRRHRGHLGRGDRRGLGTLKLADQATSIVFVAANAVVVGTSAGAAALYIDATTPIAGRSSRLITVASTAIRSRPPTNRRRPIVATDGQLAGDNRDARQGHDLSRVLGRRYAARRRGRRPACLPVGCQRPRVPRRARRVS
jgi:hypothetical protein